MVHYGFCYPNNRYDSYSVHLKLKIDMNRKFVPHMVALKKTNFTQEVRFKTDQLNLTVMSYLRVVCMQNFYGQKD